MARKLGNLGALAPVLRAQDISGLVHTSKLDRQVWAEFPEMVTLLPAVVLLLDVPMRGSLLTTFIIVVAGGLSFAGIGLLVTCRRYWVTRAGRTSQESSRKL